MRIEFTKQQFHKLRNLVETSAWFALLALVDEGGAGDYKQDLEGAVAAGLVQRNGPTCHVKFHIDGIMPGSICKPHKTSNDLAAYIAVWHRVTLSDVRQPPEFAALKRCAANYSISEFEQLVARYWALESRYKGIPTIADMWSRRGKFAGKVKEDESFKF